MSSQNFDITKIDTKIHLLTFGYIREYISTEYNDIEIPKNIILLCACFANIYMNSKILKDYSQVSTFMELVSSQLTNKSMNECNLELIYRSSRDGSDGNSFWNKCKLMDNIFILIHNNNNHKFGCYLSIKLENKLKRDDWKTDRKCFIYQIEPNQIIYKHNEKNSLTACFAFAENRILWLGDYCGAINIQQNFTKPKTCQSDSTCQTFVGLNCKELVGGKSDGNNRRYYWNIVEMEVFRLKDS